MRFWWVVAMIAVVVDCGGSSVRRGAAGDGGDGGGSEDGGTSGSAGTRGGTAGTSTAGATSPTGGRGGGGGTTAVGGRISGGGSGGSGNSAGQGADAGDGGVGGGAGAAGAPSCEFALVGGSDCSREETCQALECGAPWSIYDVGGCGRTECTETGVCPFGERCVPAPVLGKYDDPCFYHPDSCDNFGGPCACSVWEECLPLALCLPEGEFPPSRDCPIDAPIDCVALSQAVETLEAYRDGTEFIWPYEPAPVLSASVESCATRLADALQAECD